MTAVRYTGPHDEVEVPDLAITVKRNHKVEVSDDAAATLVLQEVWELVEDKPKTAKKKAAKPKPATVVAQPSLPPEGLNEVRFPIGPDHKETLP